MKRLLLFFAVLLPAACSVHAQVIIEEEVQTDTIDIESLTAQAEPSRSNTALFATLVLPGLGHHMNGSPSRALVFGAAEAVSIFGAVVLKQYSNVHFNAAKSYAGTWAGAEGGDGATDFYWKNVGRYMDSDGLNPGRVVGYNQIQENNRTGEDKYLADNLQWRWPNDSLREEYNEFLDTSIKFNVASSFFLGAMVLNRLVAFIDLRARTKFTKISSLKAVPFYSLRDNRSGIVLRGTF